MDLVKNGGFKNCAKDLTNCAEWKGLSKEILSNNSPSDYYLPSNSLSINNKIDQEKNEIDQSIHFNTNKYNFNHVFQVIQLNQRNGEDNRLFISCWAMAKEVFSRVDEPNPSDFSVSFEIYYSSGFFFFYLLLLLF